MEFVKEFATFMLKEGVIKFGNFTLSSGKKSSFYVDLRIVPSFPNQFRKMIKNIQAMINADIGQDDFDGFVSIPTGGLVVASALAFETLKPLIYVRNKPKSYGLSKEVEGNIYDGMKLIMIDDVATTGASIVSGIQSLKEQKEKITITDAYVIVNRLDGADKLLESQGVKIHQLLDILQITETLNESNLVSDEIFQNVKEQIK